MTVSVWILGDQLLVEHPALDAATAVYGAQNVRVVLIESAAALQRRRYQRRKLALLLSAMRHYAIELRAQGFQVDLRRAPDFAHGLRAHLAVTGAKRLLTMAAANYDGRFFQQETLPALLPVPVDVLPNSQFLTGQVEPFPEPGKKRVVMETFYRHMRRALGILVEEDGRPTGGSWNFDEQNRRPLPAGTVAPPRPGIAPDALTQEVLREVAALPLGTGDLAGFNLAVTQEQAAAELRTFVDQRLAAFGPYEDAMSSEQTLLFHSFLAPYLNIGLLTPRQMVAAALAAYEQGRVPLNSVEGFVRQVIGWREYMYWQYWRLMPGLADGNSWGAKRALPDWFWNGRTDMACLRHVINRAIDEGYTHHIERLMVVSNFCLLAGIQPQAVLGWFMDHYLDAYDWVMQSNVVGMGLNADGGLIATKPYIASANYINKMSDYCSGCRYDHKTRVGADACPFNFLYWNFLLDNEQELRANPRLGPNVLGLRHLDQEQRTAVQRQAAVFLRELDVD